MDNMLGNEALPDERILGVLGETDCNTWRPPQTRNFSRFTFQFCISTTWNVLVEEGANGGVFSIISVLVGAMEFFDILRMGFGTQFDSGEDFGRRYRNKPL